MLTVTPRGQLKTTAIVSRRVKTKCPSVISGSERRSCGTAASKVNGRQRAASSATPAIAQLVEHLTVDACSDQMVPGSIPGGRMLCHAVGLAVGNASARTQATAHLMNVFHSECLSNAANARRTSQIADPRALALRAERPDFAAHPCSANVAQRSALCSSINGLVV